LNKRNPYEVLGVSEHADDREIKSAYRLKTLDCHPDLHPDDPEKEKQFRELGEALSLIDTEAKRRNMKNNRGITLSRGPAQAVESLFRKVAELN
jgi:curved DNA-binding protein CbpA